MDKDKMKEAVRELLIGMGEDPDREGLQDTPRRVAEMYEEILADKDVKYTTFTSENDENDLVVVKRIDFTTLCEHHLLPFEGTVSIGYFPNKKVLGLSKFARVVDKHANKLQLQERLMRDISSELKSALSTDDIAIFVEAKHYCMITRGVKKKDSTTITTSFSGKFKDPINRQEFLSHVRGDY